MAQTATNAGQRGQAPLLVALTGGVASGKSAAADFLAELGAPIIDTDRIAREVVATGTTGLKRLVEAFGDDVLAADGSLDRRRMRELVFADDSMRQRLEAILHPLIEAEARHRIARLGDHSYVVVVVPLLVETGVFGDADRVIVVDVPEEVQVKRLAGRDGIDLTSARKMLAAQATRQQRLAVADHVVDNSSSLAALGRAVERLHRQLLEHADNRGGPAG